MALLKQRDVIKMSDNERKSKLEELKFALVKGNVSANKATAKTKEIKRAISRLLTFSTSQKGKLETNKKT